MMIEIGAKPLMARLDAQAILREGLEFSHMDRIGTDEQG